jgi:hypothetical protein
VLLVSPDCCLIIPNLPPGWPICWLFLSLKIFRNKKRSSDNLEDELQQQKKPQSDSIVVDSSPSSYGDEGLLNNSLFRDMQSLVQYSLQQFSTIESIAHQNRYTECCPTQRVSMKSMTRTALSYTQQ